MAEVVLEFEKPIVEMEKKLEDVRKRAAEKQDEKLEERARELEQNIEALKKDVFGNLSRWEKVQLSRHPQRPYSLDYIEAISEEFVELFGDRHYADDKAIVGGFGKVGQKTIMFIGQQKGRDTKSRQFRNFGMPNPEGYRKALRLMKLAEKFGKPIVTLIDTPGAYPGLEAEERGQGEAIARNLMEMSVLKVPVICIIIGEGASGGALGIGIGDKIYQLENTWYSVISPESCSSILWRSWDHKEKAAESLKLTAEDNLRLKIIDGIIPEPLGGAHRDPETVFKTVRQQILKDLRYLRTKTTEKLVEHRINKFASMGVFEEEKSKGPKNGNGGGNGKQTAKEEAGAEQGTGAAPSDHIAPESTPPSNSSDKPGNAASNGASGQIMAAATGNGYSSAVASNGATAVATQPKPGTNPLNQAHPDKKDNFAKPVPAIPTEGTVQVVEPEPNGKTKAKKAGSKGKKKAVTAQTEEAGGKAEKPKRKKRLSRKSK